MITKISAEEFKSAIAKTRGLIPEKIRFLSFYNTYNDLALYKVGRAYLFIMGESATVFGKGYKKDELYSFLSFLSVKKVLGNAEKFNARELFVMAAKTKKEREYIPPSVLPSVSLLARVFNVKKDDIYSDICTRINKKSGMLFSHPHSSAFMHISEKGCLLTAVAVEPDFRKKGLGKRLLKDALQYTDKTVYAVCEKELVGFYEKCGFKNIGTALEGTIGEK